ncbi:MAG TPA: SIMPL domain-containing protein [Ilumatobacteraceae bacterium]|nr:SIMPL domain-containing protein [Ilumatobacteraceae bacterium]
MSAQEKSITVKGDGHVKVKPDTATLNLGVQATGRTATEALTQANTSAADLIAALKAGGVDSDDIATSGLSIYPQYAQQGVAVSGYQASNNVTVTVRDISKAGPLIDAAAGSAGDHITVGGVSFFVDDVEAVMGAARAEAINNARKRAEEYASAAGVTVGAVVQISELSTGGPQPIFARAAKLSLMAEASTPIEAGMQDLSVSVTVVFELS